MAEVSKESISECAEVTAEDTENNVEMANGDSPVETKTGPTLVKDSPVETKTGPTFVKDSSVETKTGLTFVKDPINNSSNNDNVDTAKTDDKDAKSNDSETEGHANGDSVTVISENGQLSISPDDDKSAMLEDGPQEKAAADVNDDIIEVTSSTEPKPTEPKPKELNVEEGGEWSVKSRLQSFLKWTRSKGLYLSPKVVVKSEGTCHRYGMIATDDIKKGECLISTSRSLVFSPDNSRIVAEIVDYEDWLDSIGQSLDDSSGWATLLIALMVEFNDVDSFWAPYLRLVPKPEECGHPLFWSIEEHKDELRGTTLLYDIQRDIYNIESEYKQFILPFIYRYKDICGTVERYNLALYKRLVAFVMSYSFTEDFDAEPSMIPLADLLNHSGTNNNAKLVFGDENVDVIAIRDINKGEEILNTFGKLGNAELLQTYGYTDKEPNIYDTLPILVNTFLDVMEKEKKVSDSYFQAKVSLLNKTEIAHSDDFFLFDRNGMRKGPDLVQMLKILFMTETEIDDLLKSRAGHRPDSFYQKLLRKLKLSKKTDTSSGVAIIDITEEEPEQEPAPKRKMDIELHEIDDSEPPTKQICDMPLRNIPVIELTNRDPQRSFPLNIPDNGNSIGNAIVIDDDDSDDDSDNDDCKKTENTNSTDLDKPDKSGTIDEEQPDAKNEKNDDTIVMAEESSNLSSTEGTNILPVNDNECLDEEKPEESEKPEEEPVDKPQEEKESSNSPENKDANSKEDASNVMEEDTNSKEVVECVMDGKNDASVEVQKQEEQKDSMKEKEGLEINDCPVVNKESTNGVHDEVNGCDSGDEIKIVSEDVRCKMTFENLIKNMQPEWREFIKRVIDFQINALKPDELSPVDKGRGKMTDRQFYSHQIRNGHRIVAKTFISVLNSSTVEK